MRIGGGAGEGGEDTEHQTSKVPTKKHERKKKSRWVDVWLWTLTRRDPLGGLA